MAIVRGMSNDRAVRILLVTHTAEVGGAEAALLRLLDAVDRRRFTPAVVTFADGALVEALHARGVPVTVLAGGAMTRVTRREAGGVGALWRHGVDALRVADSLRAHIAGGGFDLVGANSLKAAVVVALAAPLARRPWVWHLHDRLAADYLSAPLVAGLRLLAAVGPRAIVANSRATAATAGRGARGKVSVAYPGLPFESFTAPRWRPRGAVGIVGRVSATKGQREFLEAAERVARRYPRTLFRIVGAALFDDAAVEAELRARSARSPIANRVEWSGWVDDVPRHLRRLRMVVHASPVPEPFGQVVVEAMAAGVPVIATAAGGVPEILGAPEGESIAPGVRRTPVGVLVHPGDPDALAFAIEWILDHPAEAARTALRAHHTASRRFTIAQTAATAQDAWARAVWQQRDA